MCTRKSPLALAVALAFVAATAAAGGETPRLGKPITEADIAAWDIAVMPDGTGTTLAGSATDCMSGGQGITGRLGPPVRARRHSQGLVRCHRLDTMPSGCRRAS